MYSSGNIDVRNCVHLFESHCILTKQQAATTPLLCLNFM